MRLLSLQSWFSCHHSPASITLTLFSHRGHDLLLPGSVVSDWWYCRKGGVLASPNFFCSYKQDDSVLLLSHGSGNQYITHQWLSQDKTSQHNKRTETTWERKRSWGDLNWEVVCLFGRLGSLQLHRTQGTQVFYKGRNKNNKLNLLRPKLARLGPHFGPQNSPEKAKWLTFCVLPQEWST